MSISGGRLSLRDVVQQLAPGTVLREALDRILASGRGALIVLGPEAELEPLMSGGFRIDTNVTSQRLAELAKMDGAILIDPVAERILRANLHLVPDSSIPTSETGTRHRTAERVARQSGRPVITVSESRRTVTLYTANGSRALEAASTLLFRANQGLSTLERYRARLDEVSRTLAWRETEDSVTLREVVTLLQRAEMAQRIAREVEGVILELGAEGRLVRLQLDELVGTGEDERELVVRDYIGDRRRKVESVLSELAKLTTEELLGGEEIVLLLAREGQEFDDPVTPRGHRMLSRIPRLPDPVIEKVVSHFGTLPRIMAASREELNEVEGVGGARARAIKDGLRRMSDPALLDRAGGW